MSSPKEGFSNRRASIEEKMSNKIISFFAPSTSAKQCSIISNTLQITSNVDDDADATKEHVDRIND